MRSSAILLGLAAIASSLVSAKSIRVEHEKALEFVRAAQALAPNTKLDELNRVPDSDRKDVKFDLEDLRALQLDIAEMLLEAGENPSLTESPTPDGPLDRMRDTYPAPGTYNFPADPNAVPGSSGRSGDKDGIVVPTVDDGESYTGVGGEYQPINGGVPGTAEAPAGVSCTNKGSECVSPLPLPTCLPLLAPHDDMCKLVALTIVSQNAFTDFTKCWQVCVSSQKTKNPIGKGSDGKLPDCAKWCKDTCGCDEKLSKIADQGPPAGGATDVQYTNGYAPDRNANWI